MPPTRPFQVMLKPRGALCNLNCAYCFYLAKEQLYPGASLRMSPEVLESYTRQYIQAMTGSPEVIFAWQGGEPLLMGLDFFRLALELQRKYAPPGLRIQNALQTNATLLDDEWAAFFHEHDFLLGVSLDGPQPLHDTYRVDKGGRGTFESVMAGIRLLQRHKVEFNILACVNNLTARHPLEIYRFFRDKVGAKFIQFIPIVEKVGAGLKPTLPDSPVSSRSVGGPEWGRFLNAVFDEWVRRDVGQVFVQMFDTALGNWARAAPSVRGEAAPSVRGEAAGLPEGQAGGLCVHQPVCGQALALEHNGDLYACDHFVDPAYRLGNILETPLAELAVSPQQLRFGQDKLDALPAICLDCRVRFACHGGCPKDRFPISEFGLRTPALAGGAKVAETRTWRKDFEVRDPKSAIQNFLCQGYYAFFTHIDRPMQVMTALLKAGRAPAEIMGMLAFEESARRAGPGGACPCGSGKKVRDCHPAALQDPILRPAGKKRH